MKPLSLQFLHIEKLSSKRNNKTKTPTSSLNLFLHIQQSTLSKPCRIKHPYSLQMTISQYSKSMHLSCKTFSLILLFVYLLFVGSCTSTRIGFTTMKMKMNENTEPLRRKHNLGLVFNFFPKGVRIPPSGPSMRHNSEVDSTTKN